MKRIADLCIIIIIIINCVDKVCSLISVSSAKLAVPELQVDLEPINHTINYRIYGKNGKDDKPWFEGRGLDMRHIQCVRPGHCERLSFNTCLGAKIPYEYTSLDLTDSFRQLKVQERLQNYRALKHVPKCWAVIQPFLCSVFVPKCERINGHDMVYLPSLEMCRLTLEPCRILYNTSYFPEYLRCNETLFPSRCNNDVREMKFNVTGQCLEPLVPADNSASYYPGIEGCGVQCKDPLYTDDEHRQIHKLVAWGGSLCLLANLFVVATFFIDWENANRYPALIVFYINLCLLIVCAGWLAQFTSGSREDIVCRKDGTLRTSEPTAGENLSCVVVFVLIYYFLMAAMVWFVFLTYTWHLRAVGNVQDRIDKKGSYFHLVAWSLPLVLTISTLALSEVDGNSTVGICFVGYLNHPIRAGMLLAPMCGVILVGGYFIMRGMIMLFGLKHFANDIKSTSASNKIHLIIVRMGVCAAFTLVFILVAIACHMSEFRNSPAWTESLKRFIICSITAQFTDEHIVCKLEQRPSVAILQLHLLCLFGAGIVMSTWCWTHSSLETWKRYIKKKCGKDVMESCQMPKHKVIAQTWAKRKELEERGRLSITLYNTHTDPVGLNFDVNDLNSSETNEISSTWANYLPQFVKRRMALTGVTTNNNNNNNNNSSSQGGPRKNSIDSEISFSVRHVSVESRRNSVDSQVSVKIAEMKTKVAARTRSGGHHHHHHHHNQQKYATTSSANNKRSQRRRDFIASATGRKYSTGRRESSTSIESQVIALKKTTFPNVMQQSHKVGLFAHSTKRHHSSGGNVKNDTNKNMKRRSANAGLDPDDISDFLAKNGRQFILPFLQNQGMTTSSDEENGDDPDGNDAIIKLEISDDQEDDEEDEDDGPKIEEIYEIASKAGSCKKRHASKQQEAAALENILKNMHIQKSNESTNVQRTSRNSTRSRQSHKSQINTNNTSNNNNANCGAAGGNNQRRSTLRKSRKKSPLNTKNHDDILRHQSSISSYSSAELDVPLGITLHSSYSGLSVTGKPQSRNSKTSCDVGIQANAYEIATHNLTENANDYNNEEQMKFLRQVNLKNRRQSECGEETEMQTLLNNGNHMQQLQSCYNHQQFNNKYRETIIALTESEKLKMLLLPSK